ncbi:MAG: mechanosensitive ion channel family protein [Vicinamibacterales bacterium]
MDFATYGAALRTTLTNISDSTRVFVPNLLAATALLLGGWALGVLLRRLTIRLTRRFDGLARRSHVDDALQRIGVSRSLSDVFGAFVFWTVFLFFVAGATEALGLPVLSTWLTGVAFYLPKIVAALLIVLAGILVANLVRDALRTAGATANIVYGDALAQIVRIALISVAVLIAINELGIDVAILTVTLGVVLGAGFGGVALAFGLGARTAVSNIIGSHYLRQMVRAGQSVRLGTVEGEIEAITPTAIVLKTADGRVIVPAKAFNEVVSTLLPGA